MRLFPKPLHITQKYFNFTSACSIINIIVMNSKVLPYYDSASGIFYKNYFGDILLENIISSWEEIIKQKLPLAKVINLSC